MYIYNPCSLPTPIKITMAHSQFLSLPLVVLILTLCCSQGLCGRQLDDEKVMLKRYEQWMGRYGRVYEDVKEKQRRLKIFKENVKFIEAFNKQKNQKYTLSINPFADLTKEERQTRRNGNMKNRMMMSKSMNKSTNFRYGNVSDVSSSVDWREKGAVTPVKSQGYSCGSCWAFAAVAAVEGVHQIKNGDLIRLSEQQIVDCNDGCNGGFTDQAFEFIHRNKGLSAEANYPYTGEGGSCNTRKDKAVVSIGGYEAVPINNEHALLQAVANQPVTVVVDFHSSEIQFYSGGVFTGPCGTNLSHAVTIVGYGTSSDGTKFWLAKNSWSSRWGENGYIRLQRDVPAKEGLCGIAMQPFYPVEPHPIASKQQNLVIGSLNTIAVLICIYTHLLVLLP